jgi:hypothetical protein
MAKRKTLRERAKYFAQCQNWSSSYQINPATGERFRTGPTMDEGVELGWMAGWRANQRSTRISAAQRRVVEAARLTKTVWIVQSKTTAAVFSSKAAADVWVSNQPASAAGGMRVSETPLFHLKRAKGDRK